MIPLQIFEKHPNADAYRVGGFYSPYALVSTEKRFSDAELAAEYWAAAECATAILANGGIPIRASRKLKVVAKFATRPHAHESDYE